ncbi:MAG: RsmB/NOP family class I SAM-dependent RNA methyltransferase [Clostridiales bacterium]|nr:RsmB/NOP family class I SAM-dependent RNA methyltransferase [Clostridiales bacterium]
MNLPQEFLARMEALLGDEFPAFLQSFEEPRRYGLRVNTLKISVEEFQRIAPFHLTPIPWIDNGFFYEKEDAVSRHPFYYAGLYYLQEPSAMTPAQLLPVTPGERVLDLCAAPGGKATALAAKLQGQGLLVANDISASRAKALLKNLELFGVTNALVTNTAPNLLAAHFPETFDKILVDAPCSGEGMFRKDAASAAAWSLKKVSDCAGIQKEIVSSAVSMLRPGGMMLYSTCTFSPEEDEQVIAHLLKHHPEMQLLELPMAEGFAPGRDDVLSEDWLRRGERSAENQAAACLSGGNPSAEHPVPDLPGLSRCVRIFPHKMPGEGHFMALLRKRGGDERVQKTTFSHADMLAGDPALTEYQTGEKPKREDLPDFRTRKKSGKKQKQQAAVKKTDTERQAVETFLQEILQPENMVQTGRTGQTERTGQADQMAAPGRNPVRTGDLDIHGNQVYSVPEAIRALNITGGIPFLRSGLYLGEIRKDRFEPSQALAMALRSGDCAPEVILDFDCAEALSAHAENAAHLSGAVDDRLRRYLCGETIEVDDLLKQDCLHTQKGWCLVCVNGFPLGWGRCVNGTLKNKYHPGWRMKQ